MPLLKAAQTVRNGARALVRNKGPRLGARAVHPAPTLRLLGAGRVTGAQCVSAAGCTPEAAFSLLQEA